MEEILSKLDNQGQKYREQHHQTVRYFEQQMAVMKIAGAPAAGVEQQSPPRRE